ncbi:hypothetical protein KPA93_32560 [Burkholderia cenocepacia]|uniref:dual OB domain-containing protein n=1 Tax=Burkholderia cenocepacia TaxID=95486 RepID=UPI00285EBC96|nr:hypothetical protein [Burkholderia cenocepacia]MDR8027959.1 hypothetical protein [Burkholderia cenocepacia]MDR8045194.1 hypothetical protein [Burkholderia cenocepacia]
MYEITILCLANSRKPPSGRCIAGKRIDRGQATTWLRPVSERPSHEVSEEERRYEEGTKAQLLDIVTIPLLRASPNLHQVENHTLDDEYYWTKQGVATWDQVIAAVDEHDVDFWAHAESTYHGLNDKVCEAELSAIGSSLKLIAVGDLQIRVRREDGYEGRPARRRVRGRFTYEGQTYLMSVTDPEIEESYLTQGDGDYPVGVAALCISLVEPWNGYAFRVIASVITPARCEAAT